MTREDLIKTLNSIVLGVIIAVIGAILLYPVYEKEHAERQALERAWVEEQIAEEAAYRAEVEAEKQRWEELEALEKKVEKAEAPIETNLVIIRTVTYDDYIPDDVEDAARYWGKKYSIAPEFLEAVAYHESRFNPEATNGSCLGLMQVCPHWHSDRAEKLGFTEEDLMTIDGSMAVAADYLRELFDTCEDPYWVLMTYNGDSNADAYLNLEHAPSEYALNVCDTAFNITKTHEEGGQCEFLQE